MGRFLQYAPLLLLGLQYQAAVAFEPVTTIMLTLTIVNGIITFSKYLWGGIESSNILDQHAESDEVYIPGTKPSPQDQIIQQLRLLSAKSDRLRDDVQSMKDILLQKIPIETTRLYALTHHMSKIFVNSQDISQKYDNFVEYISAPKGTYDIGLLTKFAEDVVSESSCGIKKQLLEIHSLLVRRHIGISAVNVLDLLAENVDLFLEYTKASKTPQQLVYNLLYSVIFTEIKGFLVTRYGYKILENYKGGHYKYHIKRVVRDFAIRISEKIAAFKQSMKFMSREFLKDDPEHHKEDETFTELNYVFQAFLVSEKDIFSGDKCWFYCENYPEVHNYKHNCYEDRQICSKQRRCQGDLYDCGYKIQNDMNVCISTDTNSKHRYEYIIDGEGGTRGKGTETCDVIKVENWKTFIPAARCDICTCVCAETTPEADRRFNLNPSTSRFAENYVVTGARLVKQNHMIHIQIQEGQLLPCGIIDESTLTWVPIDKSTNNYHTLTWNNGREVNLGDLEVPEGDVLVGLSFSTIQSSDKNKRLYLEIYSKPLNFTRGEVLNKATTIRNNNEALDEINLNYLDIPTRIEAKSDEFSKPSQYFKFGITGLKADAGQHTVPFIDVQNLTTFPATPCSGAGLYHKRREGSAGFLALKLISFNVEPYLEASLPDGYSDLESIEI